MNLSEVGACAILTIERFQQKHGVRPGALYFGPEEYEMMMKDGLTQFYGIPVLPMTQPGVMAKAEEEGGGSASRETVPFVP